MHVYPQSTSVGHTYAEHDHREFSARLQRLHELAESTLGVGAPLTVERLRESIDHALEWVHDELMPHMAWEESALYPECDRRAGTGWATLMARHEHGQLRAVGRRLRDQRAAFGRPSLGQADRAAMAAELLAFEAVLRAHLERENWLVLPLLDTEPPLVAQPPSRMPQGDP